VNDVQRSVPFSPACLQTGKVRHDRLGCNRLRAAFGRPEGGSLPFLTSVRPDWEPLVVRDTMQHFDTLLSFHFRDCPRSVGTGDRDKSAWGFGTF
jgi:hypothetical protein